MSLNVTPPPADADVSSFVWKGWFQSVYQRLIAANFDVAAHIADTIDAHDASAISNVAAGNIVATTVQAAINELDTEKVAKAGDTMTGNLTFSGNSLEISGEMSSATLGNNLAFQSSTVNGYTSVQAKPNGTSLSSYFVVFNAADMNNAGYGYLGISASAVDIFAGKIGTGSYLPIDFYTNGSRAVRIDTSGNVGIGTTTVYTNTALNVASGMTAAHATIPCFQWYNSGAGADLKYWRAVTNTSGSWLLAKVNDAYNTATTAITVATSGNATFEGYTELGGSAAPAVKMKKLTGTTSGSSGGTTSVAHGLTRSKIISVTVQVDDGGSWIPPRFNNALYDFTFYVDGTNVNVQNNGAATSIYSKSFTVLIIYEE